MTVLAYGTSSGIPVVEFVAIVATFVLAIVGAGLLWDAGRPTTTSTPRVRRVMLIDRERDIAAGLGWPFRRWVLVRAGLTIGGLLIGLWSHIILMIILGPAVGFLGFRFALAGRAASRRLKMERAFLGQLRNLRDRMAVSNQSLDTALQEIGRNPGPELEYVFAPLVRGGSVVDNIVEVGRRSRSPVVESSCGVLLWARSRSLDALIAAIEEILLPVGDAQLAVQEEAIVTLTQQRAVTFAMAGLMAVMFVVVVSVPIFAAYYQTFEGNAVLFIAMAIFFGLIAVLGVIVRVEGWTRWDMKKLAQQQDRIGV